MKNYIRKQVKNLVKFLIKEFNLGLLCQPIDYVELGAKNYAPILLKTSIRITRDAVLKLKDEDVANYQNQVLKKLITDMTPFIVENCIRIENYMIKDEEMQTIEVTMAIMPKDYLINYENNNNKES